MVVLVVLRAVLMAILYTPEMASERMRILIRKFELSSIAISSRCLAALETPEMLPDCSQSHFEKILRIFFPTHPRSAWSGLSALETPEMLPDCSRSHVEKILWIFVFLPPLGPPGPA